MKKLLKLPVKAGKYVIKAGEKVKIYFQSLRLSLTMEIKEIKRLNDSIDEEIRLEEDEIKQLLESRCSNSGVDAIVSPQLKELKNTRIQLEIENRIPSYLHQDRITYSLCKFLKALQRHPQDN
jgi:ATP-dependent Lon protease